MARRKPKYEDLSVIQGRNESRKASEYLSDPAVQRIMEEADAYERALDLEADAIQHVSNRRADYTNLSVPDSTGDKFRERINDPDFPLERRLNLIKKMDEELENLENFPGGVPAPRVFGNTRLHTNYEENPITKERQVVPYMDPSSPDDVLKTTFGQMRIVPQGPRQNDKYEVDGVLYDNPSEYVGVQALKLMGIEGQTNNQELVWNRRKQKMVPATWRADLVDGSDPSRTIDVERGDTSIDKDTLGLQLTANLKPTTNQPGGMALLQFMKNNPEVKNIVEAVQQIRGKEAQTMSDTFYYGKAFKSDLPNEADRIKEILSLAYRPGSIRPEKAGIAVPILGADMLQIGPALQAARELSGKLAAVRSPRDPVPAGRVKIHSQDYKNDAGGRYDPRSKVKINVPKGYSTKSGDVISEDLTINNPLINQLMETLPTINQ